MMPNIPVLAVKIEIDRARSEATETNHAKWNEIHRVTSIKIQ